MIMYMNHTNVVVSLGLVGQISLPLRLTDLNDGKKNYALMET